MPDQRHPEHCRTKEAKGPQCHLRCLHSALIPSMPGIWTDPDAQDHNLCLARSTFAANIQSFCPYLSRLWFRCLIGSNGTGCLQLSEYPHCPIRSRQQVISLNSHQISKHKSVCNGTVLRMA